MSNDAMLSQTSLTYVVDKVGFRVIGRRWGDDISVTFGGAQRLRVAPSLACCGDTICLPHHHVPQGVIQIPIQQTALVLGWSRAAVVAVCRISHGVNAALFLEPTLRRGQPAKV